jgi:hypothetical protein
MKADPAWVLVSGFFLLGTLLAVVIGGGGFLFLAGYHSGLSQRPECPRPALSK